MNSIAIMTIDSQIGREVEAEKIIMSVVGIMTKRVQIVR